jgi:hypothetical protein
LIVVGMLTCISVLRFRANAGLVDHTHQVLNRLSRAVTVRGTLSQLAK